MHEFLKMTFSENGTNYIHCDITTGKDVNATLLDGQDYYIVSQCYPNEIPMDSTGSWYLQAQNQEKRIQLTVMVYDVRYAFFHYSHRVSHCV